MWFLLVLFLGVEAAVFAQPVHTGKRRVRTYSRAASLFTLTKDKFFSNYSYQDELKNVEWNLDAFLGPSINLISYQPMYGQHYGLGLLVDYYFQEGVGLRSGIRVRNNQLYRFGKADIFGPNGEYLGVVDDLHYMRFTQLTLPLHFVFTQFRHNHGIWWDVGLDPALNIHGFYRIHHRSNPQSVVERVRRTVRIPPGVKIENIPPNAAPYFDRTDHFSSFYPKTRKTYYQLVTLYASLSIGWKANRFINLYGRARLNLVNQANRHPSGLSDQSLTFGMMMSLWQY